MPNDDPAVKWELASPFGILVDEANRAWHSGHVDDVIEFADGRAILVASESGGLWLIDPDAGTLPLSSTWDNPDVKCIAMGPDGPRHLFAGCTIAYDSAEKRSYKAESGSAPVIMETDSAQFAPLLNWNPVTALPTTAGRITRIVAIFRLRRIVVACASVRTGDTGGIFWSIIPATRFAAGDPPRPPFKWTRAKVIGAPAAEGFWDLAVAATRNEPSRVNLEDKRTITLVAGGFKGGGLVVGQWDSADELVFSRASLAFEDGTDATGIVFDSCGTTSVSSCERLPTVLYAACAWPDGRLKSLMRSKDGGRGWVLCSGRVAGAGTLDLIQPLAGGQGKDWNNCISAHPKNPDVAALGWQAGPFLTFDSGTTWRLVEGGEHLHADLHALHFTVENPDSIGNLFVGSDGGLAKINLDDLPGEHGSPIRSDYNSRLPTLQCLSTLIRQFAGTIHASPKSHEILVAGLQDNGNVTCNLIPEPKQWGHVDRGDGGWNAFVADGSYLHNVMNEAVIVTSFVAKASFEPDVQRQTIPINLPAPPDPSGLKWAVGEPVVQPTFRNAGGQLLMAMASPGESNRVYGLYTPDLTVGVMPLYHWDLIATLPDGARIGALGSFSGENVFIGTGSGQGKMYVLDVATGGLVEEAVQLPKPSPSTQMKGGSFLRIVGFSESSMFALLLGATEVKLADGSPPLGTPAVQGYVLRLDANTWKPTAGAGLPNEYVYGFVAISAPNTEIPHGLMAATDDAVYLSRDEGETWQRASSGLPRRAHCGDLRFVIDSFGTQNIYLGTFGRSMWVARLA
ncbi:MAG TPA: hypothetical protein VGQ22_24585 [Steroidobacteraceae bacterium]|jgi:hypothetical protein|nr:hypothetical protein [Steroidobacteraceae bacterium]